MVDDGISVACVLSPQIANDNRVPGTWINLKTQHSLRQNTFTYDNR